MMCLSGKSGESRKKSNKSFKLNDFSIIYPKFCDHHGQLSASRFTTQVLIHFCAFIKVSLTSFSFTWESKQLSDATHMLINHTQKKKRGQREHRRDIISFEHVLFWPCWHVACVPAQRPMQTNRLFGLCHSKAHSIEMRPSQRQLSARRLNKCNDDVSSNGVIILYVKRRGK